MEEKKKELEELNNCDVMVLQEAGITCRSEAVELNEARRIKMPSYLAREVNSALRLVPGLADLCKGDTYTVFFDKGVGALQKSTQHPGFLLGNVVNPDTNNKIVDVALWKKTSRVPDLFNIAFSGASFAVGQYYMASIDMKLNGIQNGISNIKEYLDTDKKSKIIASFEFLRKLSINIRSISGNELQKQGYISELIDIRLDAQSWMIFYSEKLDNIKRNASHKDKHEAVESLVNDYVKCYANYRSALFIYCYSHVLETVLSGNTSKEYLGTVYSDITIEIENYKNKVGADERFLRNYISNNKTYKIDKKHMQAAKAIGLIAGTGLGVAIGGTTGINTGARMYNLLDDAEKGIKKNKSEKLASVEKTISENDVYLDLSNLYGLRDAVNEIDEYYNSPAVLVKKDGEIYIGKVDE